MTTPDYRDIDPQAQGLGQFLAALKRMQGGKYGWRGRAEGSVHPFGAYGMIEENWEAWSSTAGLGGHDKWDPAGQDYVAAYWAQKLFQRYGDWDMVAAAWFAGAEDADRAARSGQGADWFQNLRTKKWVKDYRDAVADPEIQQAQVPKAGRRWINPQGAPKGWLMPVAGKAEYSNSFMVPRNNKLGIHGAIDVYAKKGTPIVAPVGGTVISVKSGGKGGHTVRVRGNDGLVYYFAHMDQQAVVTPGEQVKPGTHLGFVGDSGNARGTSPHLHFSVRKGGVAVNPYTYLQGSKNAGNYYSPEHAAHQEEAQPSTRTRYNAFLESLSNQVAGGVRTDYRELGLVTGGSGDDEDNNPDSTGNLTREEVR